MARDFYKQLTSINDSSSPSQSPLQSETILALKALVEHVIIPCYRQFRDLQLTYGFCSNELRLQLLKKPLNHISPQYDQHCSHELNQLGKRICNRDGAACDFYIPNLSSKVVAKWIIEKVPFDRLYYYGKSRPIHVSYGPEHSREVVFMHEKNGRRYPKRFKKIQDQHFEYN